MCYWNQILAFSAGSIGQTFSTRNKPKAQQKRYREALYGYFPTVDELERYTKQKLVLEYETRTPIGQYQNLLRAYLEGEFKREEVKDQISGLWVHQGLQDRENTFRPTQPQSIAEEMEIAEEERRKKAQGQVTHPPEASRTQEKRKRADSTMVAAPQAKKLDIESETELST